jgi:hypothetical protein
VVGVHFFNPAPIMPLVEIIPAITTSESVIAAARALVEGDALLARVPAVDALHVSVLGQVAGALADPNDVECRAASREPLGDSRRQVAQHAGETVGRNHQCWVGHDGVSAHGQSEHVNLLAIEAIPWWGE